LEDHRDSDTFAPTCKFSKCSCKCNTKAYFMFDTPVYVCQYYVHI